MEEINIDKFLEKFNKDDFSMLERIILSTDGTVQTLLSVIFQSKVSVELLYENHFPTVINRKILFALNSGEIIAEAITEIFPYDARKTSRILKKMNEDKLGLGQMIKFNSLPSQRHILKIEKNEDYFSRTYIINTSIFKLQITEKFPVEIFKRVLNG